MPFSLWGCAFASYARQLPCFLAPTCFFWLVLGPLSSATGILEPLVLGNSCQIKKSLAPSQLGPELGRNRP